MKIQQLYSYIDRLIEKREKKLDGIKIDDTNNNILFLHIPKCGGTSLRYAIRKTYGNRRKQERFCFKLDGSSARKCSQIFEEGNQEYRKKILAYVMSIEKYKYIHAHVAYSEPIYQKFGDKWHYITMLRDPLSQWFSQYFYDTREDSEVRIDSDLETFLDSDRAILMGNTYVRKLTDGIPGLEASQPKAIKQAIENLDKFTLVGVIEELDIFIKNYNSVFAVPLKVKQFNKNPVSKAKQKQKITEQVNKKVREICQPNWEVYQAALKITGKIQKK